MKPKILVTRKLLKDCEDKAIKAFEAKLNTNDELYSQSKLIELSQHGGRPRRIDQLKQRSFIVSRVSSPVYPRVILINSDSLFFKIDLID